MPLPPELAGLADRYGLSEEDRALLTGALGALPGEDRAPPPLAPTRGDEVTLPLSEWRSMALQPHARAALQEVTSAMGGGVPEEDPYEDLGLLGVGGMGEVRRVRDRALNRTMALKALRPELADDPHVLGRFIEEAQVSAQLDHPGIVPVHELGRLADGRLYFTMKEVRGRTLREVFEELHAGARGWTLRRVVDLFRKACEAVAYAHSRGVVHRDLKPDNVMVGDFGEVLVLDWGLAKALSSDALEGVRTLRHEAQDGALNTHHGVVAGTPAYMSPEQAAGQVHRVGPHSDVYALGAVLYHLLAGEPPFAGLGSQSVVAHVANLQRPKPLPADAPEDLVELTLRAMTGDPLARYADASPFVEQLTAWLEGARRRERALAVIAEADALLPEVEALRREAGELQAQAKLALKVLPAHAPSAEKREGWAMEDQAAALSLRAHTLTVARVRRVRDALNHDPTLPEAHRRLADHHRDAHAQALAHGDLRAMAEHEAGLEAHDREGRHAAYLHGESHASLQTDPPGARVRAAPYVAVDRRLAPGEAIDLGVTPLERAPLASGSWLLLLEAEGHEAVRYPVFMRRGEDWVGAAAVALPPLGALGPDEVYVPGGPSLAGGDPEVFRGLPAMEVEVDGFVIQRHPVTNAHYLRFLNALVAADRAEEAHRHAPRERPGLHGEEGALIYGVDEAGRFHLAPDVEGDMWQPDWPVLMVSWFGAHAYGRWMAEQTGQPWRLPSEWEWERAARGVDRRRYPWGEHLDPSWCNMQHSQPGRALVASVSAFPDDLSPYGVRGLGGNARDWCVDRFREEGPPVIDRRAQVHLDDDPSLPGDRVFRGGSWGDVGRCRAAERYGARPSARMVFTSFRLARSWPAPRGVGLSLKSR